MAVLASVLAMLPVGAMPPVEAMPPFGSMQPVEAIPPVAPEPSVSVSTRGLMAKSAAKKKAAGDKPANLYKADLVKVHLVKNGRDSVRFGDSARLSKAAAEVDIDDFMKWMRKYYPDSIRVEDSFLSKWKKEIDDSVNVFDFFNSCRLFINQFRDSHLTMKTVVSTSQYKEYAPHVDFGFFDGKLLITRVSENYVRYYGLQVDSVDGVPAAEVIRLVENRVGNYDGDSRSMRQLADAVLACPLFYDNDIYTPRVTHLALCESDDNSVKYKMDDAWTECKSFVSRPLRPSFVRYLAINRKYDASGQGNADRQNHQFKYLSDSVAYLGISSFEFGDKEIAEIQSQVKIAARLKVPNLILDLRNNHGGYIPAMTGVLSYLFTRRPIDTHSYACINDPEVRTPDYDFRINEYRKANPTRPNLSNLGMGHAGVSTARETRGDLSNLGMGHADASTALETRCERTNPEFDTTKYYLGGQYEFDCAGDSSYAGRVFVMVNPQTFSAAAVMAAIIKRNRRGVIVGTETPAAYASSTGMYIFTYTMKNSGLRINVPIAKTVYDDEFDNFGTGKSADGAYDLSSEFPSGRGVMPDYPVEFSRDVIFDNEMGKDMMLNYVLKLISAGRYRAIVPLVEHPVAPALRVEPRDGLFKVR